MMLHFGITHRLRPDPLSIFRILYVSSLFLSAKAAFGDRLASASVPGLSYLPPTPTDTDSTLTLPSSTSEQRERVPTAATNDGLGSDTDGLSVGGFGGLGTGQVGAIGTDDASGIGIIGVGGTDGLGVEEVGGTGVSSAAEIGGTGFGEASGVELGQTSGLGTASTGERGVAESGGTSGVQSGDDADDGIPGRAGIDYPTLAAVPDTGFSCRNYDLPGYYVDQEAQCQVFYICQAGGRQDGFLCPNGTMFNQQFLVCDWWYNVECSEANTYFSINERIYAGPGSRAVIFPDEEIADAPRSQQPTNAASDLPADPSAPESVRSGPDGSDTSVVPVPGASSVATPIIRDYGDYDGVSGDYDTVFSDFGGESITTDSAVVDYLGGSSDYGEVTDGQSPSSPLGIAVSGDVSLREQDSYYSYLPPDQAFPTEAAGGFTPDSGYGVPLDISNDAVVSGSLTSEASTQPEDVTAYSYAPTEEATGTPTFPSRGNGDDFVVTPSAFDDSNIDAILEDAGNLGGFPDSGNTGYKYPEPLNPLSFESFRTSTAPDSPTTALVTRGYDEEDATSPGLPLAPEVIEEGYSYSTPPDGGLPLPSTSNQNAVTTTPTGNRGVSSGNRPEGYSYRQPANPLLLPGEEPVLPPSEAYLPPPAS